MAARSLACIIAIRTRASGSGRRRPAAQNSTFLGRTANRTTTPEARTAGWSALNTAPREMLGTTGRATTKSLVCARRRARRRCSTTRQTRAPEAHWAGWIALSFLLSFAWWFAAVFGCTGLGQFTHHPKLKCALTLAIIVNCLMTMILWHGLVNPIYGSNELVGLMGVLGLPSGVIVAFVFSRVVLPRLIARARIQREETVRMAAQARDEELCVELAARSGEMTVHVNLLDGNRIPIDVDRSDTIDTLRRKIHGKAGLNHECQRLLHSALVDGVLCGRSSIPS